MLVDLDGWHNDQKKYEREGLGKTSDSDSSATQLPGMMFRNRAADDYRLMTWPTFRIFNMTKLHGALFRVRPQRFIGEH
jgi:hypothetical protein